MMLIILGMQFSRYALKVPLACSADVFFGKRILIISLQNVWQPSAIFNAEEGWGKKEIYTRELVNSTCK